MRFASTRVRLILICLLPVRIQIRANDAEYIRIATGRVRRVLIRDQAVDFVERKIYKTLFFIYFSFSPQRDRDADSGLVDGKLRTDRRIDRVRRLAAPG